MLRTDSLVTIPGPFHAADPDSAGTVLRGLLYRSRAAVSRRDFEASRAVHDFAARNEGLGLGGYLHMEDGFFYQFLEGAPDALEAVWQSIRRDPRHTAVTLLFDGVVPERRFACWAMGYNSDEEQSLFAWTARSDLSPRGRNSAQGIIAFLEYTAAAASQAA